MISRLIIKLKPAAFFVVKVDNLTYFFQAIFDAVRWPSAVLKGALAFVFTSIIAYSGEAGHPFRSKPITDSGQAEHLDDDAGILVLYIAAFWAARL